MSRFLAGLLFSISGGIWVWLARYKPSVSDLYTWIGLLLVTIGILCIMTSLIKRPAGHRPRISSTAKDKASQ